MLPDFRNQFRRTGRKMTFRRSYGDDFAGCLQIVDLGVPRSSRGVGTNHLQANLHVNFRRFGGGSQFGSHFSIAGDGFRATALGSLRPSGENLSEPSPQRRRFRADGPKFFPSRRRLGTRDRTRPPMRRLPKPPAELVGLPTGRCS
jgi:hypothetical protein